MHKLLAVLTAGSLSLAFAPFAFAQSVSSSSMSSSDTSLSLSSSSSSLSSVSSSSNESSARYYSPSSRSQSSASVTVRGNYRRLRSSASSLRSQAATRSSVANVADDSLIPAQCRDIMGRARAMCVIRLSRPASRSSISSSSSSMASSVASTASGSVLWNFLAPGTTLTSDDQVRRALCMLVMHDGSSSCMQGSSLREFNERMQEWFQKLGTSLSQFMVNLNSVGGDTSSGYFWNDTTFPWRGSMSGGVKGFSEEWLYGTGAMLDNTDASASSLRDRSQTDAWDACSHRTGRGQSRCVRDYLLMQNMLDASGESSSLSLHTNSY